MSGPTTIHRFTTATEQELPLVSALRQWLPDQSWSHLRKLVRSRRITVRAVLCLDEGRRLKEGEEVCVLADALPPPPTDDDVKIIHCDLHLVVVEKPAQMVTLRHRGEQGWPRWRRDIQPTLDEVIPRRITHPKRVKSHGLSPIFAVHRIDRDTSGLLVFARTEEAQVALIDQFARHEASRVYHTIIQGSLPAQTIRSRLIRNRGDGVRGSTTRTDKGYEAVTHIQPHRPLGTGHSELECRLETGRTHQIRIHLAELGHPVCGDTMYRGPYGGPFVEDQVAPRRLALHAAQLGFTHPATNNVLSFQSSWPTDIQRFMTRLLET